MPSAIEFLGKEIPIYGLCYLLGIFISVFVGSLICYRKKMPKYEMVYSAVFTAVGGLIGAKVLFVLINLKYVIQNDISFEALLKGGFVFYGGFIGGILGLLVYCKCFKERLLNYAAIYTTVLPLGHAIGRVGCLFAGCCYGMPYDGPFAVTYTHTAGDTPLNTPLFPVQGIEAALLIILFIVMLIIYFKCNNAVVLVSTYVISYSVIRFVLEYFRYDAQRGGIWLFSTSQIISIAIFVITTTLLIINKLKLKKV